MPAGPLEVRCQQALEDIVTISQRIRSSALRCANNQDNNQYVNIIERLRQQLETIRKSAETILEAITLQNSIIDEGVFTWLFSGELPLCLNRLRELDNIFNLDGQGRPGPATSPALSFRPPADNITTATALFERHREIFYFLLTPEVWNREGNSHQSSRVSQPRILPNGEESPRHVQETMARTSTERESGPNENVHSNTNQEATRQKEFHHPKLDEVLRWLAALECTDKQNETLKQRQQGTCTWFPNTGAYKVWRSCSSPFLWLHGRGGCGKSVLIASTIEHLKSTLEDGDVLVYYYCDFRQEQTTSPVEMMRSLLYQLFRHFRDCGVDAGALPNRILEEKRDGALTLNDLNQMAHLVLRAAGRFPREPMILIDALDECAEVEKLLPALSTLMHSHIRLLVTSRPLEVFSDHFKKYPSLSLHAMGKELAADIGLHITQELYSHAQLRSADTTLKRQVRERLHDKADGRFRWVQCQLDSLKRCSSRQELKDALEHLPGELETTYERILSKIDERASEAKLIRRALVWLIAALVPLRLTQLLDGLSFDPREGKIHCGTQSLGPALLDALSSLVLYDKDTDILAISHITVKEYLTSRTALPMYHIIPHEAHLEVTEMCMFYITRLLKQVRFRASLAKSETSPMLSYVFSTGLDHLAYVDPTSPIIPEVLQSFAAEIQRHPSHWDLLCEMREEDPRRFYPPWPSSRHDVMLYVLVAYSPVSLLDLFLSSNHHLRLRQGTNPLVYAADLWKTTHAITLLRSNVDVTVPGLVVDDSHYALPLEVAIDLSNDVLVGELLQRGSVVTSELLSTAVCMPWCSTRVLVKLVQTDAFTEWAREIGDEELCRAIFSSARPNAGDSCQADRDHVALARRLCELGQNLTTSNPIGAELVVRALHAAHTSMLEFLLPLDHPPPVQFLIAACTGNTPETVSVVRFLLDKKIDMRSVLGERGDTALHLAAMSSWEPCALELTKMLLNTGCDPGTRNRGKETPLSIAVRRGHVTVVEYLLSHGSPLPSHILLFALLKRQKPRMIRSLLRGGANIHVGTVEGHTALHLIIMGPEELRLECLEDEEHIVEQAIHEERPGHTIVEHAASQDDEHRQDNETADNPQEDWHEVEPEDDVSDDEDEDEDENDLGDYDDDESDDGDEDDMIIDIYGSYEEYREAERMELIKLLIESGSDPDDCCSEVMEYIAVEHGYTYVVKLYLLSLACSNFLLPPDILLTAMQYHCPSWLVGQLVRGGADVHSISGGGDTALYLAIMEYGESSCLELINILLEAGCNLTIDAEGEALLKAAIQKGYTSVVEHLLSISIPFPLDILQAALQHRLVGSMTTAAFLVRKGADLHCTTNDGDTILHITIMHYKESLCLDLIKVFIEAGCDPTSHDAQGRTVLEAAIREGYTSVVEHLLSIGVLVPPGILVTVFQNRWIYNLNPEIVALLTRTGANVHFTIEDGSTVLHLTVIHCKESLCLDLIKVFIEAGCDPDSCGAQGRTLLEAAIREGYTSVVEHLLSIGVLVPLSILVTVFQNRWIYSLNLKIVSLLIRTGADVHFTIEDGNTVLHLVVIHCEESLCLDLIKVFVEAGCDPNSRDAQGRTVLEAALRKGYTSVVEHILSYDVPLFPLDILATTLEHRLISKSRIAALLVRKGAHFTTKDGDTVLHLTATHYKGSFCFKLIKIFVDAGCDPTSYDAQGRTVLEVAISRRLTSVVRYLLSVGVPLPLDILPTALQCKSNPQIVELLVHKGANAHSCIFGGETVLHVAITTYCESTSLELVKILVSANCDPMRCNSGGKSAWMAVMERGYGSVLVLLLSSDVPHPPDILLMALWYRMAPKTIHFLICNGANAKLTTAMGDTALHLIIAGYWEWVCPELVRGVIEAGCNPSSCDGKGKSVLIAAIEKGYTSVVVLLFSYNVPLPPDILLTALQLSATIEMIEILISHGAAEQLTSPNASLQIANCMSHLEPSYRLVVVDMIRTGRRGVKRAPTPEDDDTPDHVEKRPRLEAKA